MKKSVVEKGVKNVGKAAYIQLIKALGNKKLISDSHLSRGSYKVWEWLTDNGFAKKVSGGTLDQTVKNTNYSTAQYEAVTGLKDERL